MLTLTKKITLNGSEYTLEYDWNSQIKAERLTGVNILLGDASSEGLRALVYARLLANHPGMTLEAVNKLLPGNVEALSAALHEMNEFQADVDDKGKDSLESGNGTESISTSPAPGKEDTLVTPVTPVSPVSPVSPVTIVT